MMSDRDTGPDDDGISLCLASLESIVGEFLSSVEFVMGYVQLRFSGGQLLTGLMWPVCHVGETELHWGEAGYRDALCDRITIEVVGVSIVSGDSVRIEFADGSVISISLKDDDRIGPEAVIFYGATKEEGWWVL